MEDEYTQTLARSQRWILRNRIVCVVSLAALHLLHRGLVQAGVMGNYAQSGFPIRKSPDQCLVADFPGLIADRFGSRPRLSTAADSRCTVARPPRRPESVAPRISLPLAARGAKSIVRGVRLSTLPSISIVWGLTRTPRCALSRVLSPRTFVRSRSPR
jgi:hypothetical protein